MGKHLNFFLSGKMEQFSDIKLDYPKNFASEKEELEFLIKRVEGIGPGYEVFYHEVRHSSLSELGYHVAQVIVPRLSPLYLREIDAPLEDSRIKEAAQNLGLGHLTKFNPWPHPFP